jgi:hypothetical protein
MKVAQQEIKATVTVNTSDLGNKKKDDEVDRDAPSRKKGNMLWPIGLELTEEPCAILHAFHGFQVPTGLLSRAFRRKLPLWLCHPLKWPGQSPAT